MTQDEILNALDAAGLGHWRDEAAALLQPALRLTTVPTPDADLPVGTSKMGGEPDLPPSAPWPYWCGDGADAKPIPLYFLAQINLADVAPLLPSPLPPSGILSFFYNADEDLQWTGKNEGDYSVLYTPCDVALERCVIPDALRTLADIPASFNSCAIAFSSIIPLKPLRRMGVSVAENTALREVIRQLEKKHNIPTYDDGGEHQMLGQASYLWDDITFNLALDDVGHDHYTIKDEPEGSPLRNEIAERKSKWLLLLQLDSDIGEGHPGWCWGDWGRLCFHVYHNDLAARNFDQVRMVVQCC